MKRNNIKYKTKYRCKKKNTTNNNYSWQQKCRVGKGFTETRHFYFWPNSDKKRNTLIHLYQLKCKTGRDVQTLRLYPYFWPRLVFVGVSGMWIHLYIRMYPHFGPRLVFVRVS